MSNGNDWMTLSPSHFSTLLSANMAGINREAIQKQIHQDWANREYIEVITASIKRITDFLNAFGKLK